MIIGGGFGGLYAARHLKRAPVQLTVLDRRNFHLFQPLLYQVATGALSPANIAAPLRALLKHQKNTEVLLGEAIDIDVARRQVVLRDGAVDYDTLIVATGATHHYFGHREWEKLAPGLKTIEDATGIRARILMAFEAAERETDPERLRAWLTFIVVGGGPTGVELAGQLGEMAHQTLRKDFRRIDTRQARILLVEGTDRVLPAFPQKLSASTEKALLRLGVTVCTNALVTDVQADFVAIQRGEPIERVPTHTVLWAAGVQASPLGPKLAAATGAQLDRSGRVMVQDDLTLPGHPEIFIIGDFAHFRQDGQPLPGVAQVAMQQGRYAAKLLQSRLQGQTLPPFRYHNHGNMATIGRLAAVVDLGWLSFSGFFAWLAWLFIHLIYIVQFQNRLLILMQWGILFLTRNRSARLITGAEPPRPTPESSGQVRSDQAKQLSNPSPT